MDRLASKIAAAAVIVLLGASTAGAEPPSPKGRRAAPAKKDAYRRLDEVKIVGNPERPDILFFLPRAKFRLLPMKTGADWREEILRDDIEKADLPR